MLKQWLDAGKCLMGVHQGEWTPVGAGCEQVQACVICGVETQRVEHQWADWSSAPGDPCTGVRACVRCGEREQRPQHVFGAWAYSEPHRSPVRRCDRCGAGTTYLGQALPPASQDAIPTVDAASTADPSSAGADEEAPDGPNAAWLTMLAMIRAEYDAQVARGQIARSRQPRYSSMLDELERIISAPAPDIAALQVKTRRVQEMLAGFSSSMMDPSRLEPVEAPDEHSRAGMLRTHVQALHAFVLGEAGDNQLTGDSGAAITDLVGGLHRCRDALAAPMDDDELAALERDSLRPLTLAIRQFSLREHLAVARPAWPCPVVVQDPGAVFYSGGDAVLALVRDACAARDLTLLLPQRHREPGSHRWNQVRQAALAIFDFTSYERSAAVEEMAPTAAVAYEFGIALALGRPVIIVSSAERGLPFDLDIEPVAVAGDEGDAPRIAEGIDHTLYGLQRGHAGSSVGETLAWLRHIGEAHDDLRVRVTVGAFDAALERDAVKARLVASTVLGYLGADGPELLFPSWPITYPSADAPSCFHVTAFGPAWARRTRDIVRGACPDGTAYVRGDQPLEADIIRSIWDEICGATHIVVDLTGLNANVLVELGMAHVLGRQVLLISQDPHPEQYFRAVTKHRVHAYALETDEDVEALRACIVRFLGQPSGRGRAARRRRG